MYGLQDGEQASHKEAAPRGVKQVRRVKRDEKGVQKMMGCISSGLMMDPFTYDLDALLKTSVYLQNCSCNNAGLVCTEGCYILNG